VALALGFVPVDEPDRVVSMFTHLRSPVHQFSQSCVNVPGLDHPTVDVHGHALVVELALVANHVRLVARRAQCNYQPVLAPVLLLLVCVCIRIVTLLHTMQPKKCFESRSIFIMAAVWGRKSVVEIMICAGVRLEMMIRWWSDCASNKLRLRGGSK
jgi:hypothetical protein